MTSPDIWRTKDPCEHVDKFSRSLPAGLWLNLLVRKIEAAVDFQTHILGAEAVYADKTFAIMRYAETVWLLHADTTYDGHPFHTGTLSVQRRGAGCELRLQGCDPDAAAERARTFEFEVLEAPKVKPHAMRETYIEGPDGYVWVPCVFCPAE